MPLIDGLAGFRTLRTWAGSFISEESYIKASFVYNTSQVILSSALRSFPEQAGSILKIQRTFIVLDAAFLMLDAALVCKKDNEKEQRKGKPKTELSIHIGMMLFVAACTVLIVNTLNYFHFQLATDLSKILSSKASSHEIKNVTIDWEKSLIQTVAQWLIFHRSFLHYFLWCFTPLGHDKIHVTNGGLLLARFLQISNLSFLKYQHISLQSNSSQTTGKVSNSFYFILLNSEKSYLKAAVQRIHQFCMHAVHQLNPLSFLPSDLSRTGYRYSGYIPLSSICQPAPIWYHHMIEAERLT